MTPQTILDKAADLIEKEGWIQKEAHTPEGYCAVGAVQDICFFLDAPGIVEEGAFEVMLIRVKSKSHFEHISTWNDSPERTKKEVIALLRGK